MKQYKMINLETINLITTCVDKYKQALSMYDIKGERNNFFTCDKKERHVMVVFSSMNVAKYYYIKCMNARAQHRIQP